MTYPLKSNAARDFARAAHHEVNHLYGGLPYTVHLDAAVKVGERYAHLLRSNSVDIHHIVQSAIYLHDTLEDCRISYNDLRKEFGTTIADIVYAVTNEKGKTRKDRANEKYYRGIRETRYATFVKLCDRIANVEAGGKVDMYRKEQPYFEASLNGAPILPDLEGSENLEFVRYWPMVAYLRELLNGKVQA
jgi:(p)ppGpp synthase/HD superfamily hydrolase